MDAGPQPGSAGAWTRIRNRLELGFERWGYTVTRHPWRVIAFSLAVVAALATQLPKFEIDTSSEGFLHEDDPVRIAHDEFRHQFGRDDIAIVAIETDEVFDLAFLERLRELHEAIEAEVPLLEEVTSLVNARTTRGEGDELIVGDFLEDWPETAEQIAVLRARALANPLYINQILSADSTLTTILVETEAYSSIGYEEDELAGFDAEGDAGATEASERPFLTGQENTAIVHALENVTARFDAPDFRVYLAGQPVMLDRIMNAMLRDMGRFTALSLLVIGGLLAVLFRKASAVFMCLSVATLAVVSSLSAMPLLGIPLTSPTQIMPSFLLAVAVGNSVHLLVIYFQARGRGRSCEDAIAYSLAHSGLAIVMTGLTTAGGLLSFLTAEIAPVADVGIICPIGALLALFYSLVLLPAMIAVLRPGGSAERIDGIDASMRRIPIALGGLGTRAPVLVTLAWALVLVIAIAGALRVRFSHDPIGWFPLDDPVRISMEKLNDELDGANFLEAVIDSGRENGLHDPVLLRKLDEMARATETMRVKDFYVGPTLSLVDVTKEIHQALNENRSEFRVIPDDPQLIAQELLLFENSGADDLENLVDSQFRIARFTMKFPMADAINFEPLIEIMKPRFSEILGDSATYTLTGSWSILGNTINALIRSLSRTYVLAVATIAPLMMILLGSLRLGLLSMIPNLAAIVVTLGLMGWTGIPLDAFTLMTGSIALGLAVDDTIHFMHNFRRAFARSHDAEAAVRATLESTGQALFFTSLVLTSGFFIYMFASMKNLYYFGLLTGITIAVAFLANVILAPALVTLVARTGVAGALGDTPEEPELAEDEAA